MLIIAYKLKNFRLTSTKECRRVSVRLGEWYFVARLRHFHILMFSFVYSYVHGHRQQGGGGGGGGPRVFKNGKKASPERGLIVLFFGLFSVGLPWMRLDSAIFRYFSAIFRCFFFPVTSPQEIFLPTP